MISIVLANSAAGQFIRFSVVGTLGFLVDASVLYLCMRFAGLDPFTGRLVSFLCAASFTWFMNRTYTFIGGAKHRPGRQWARFVAANGVGGAINYGVYSLLLLTSPWFRAWPVLAVAVGSVAGLAFNFTVSRKLIFKPAGPGAG